MGTTPSDIEREIADLRHETTRIVEELEYRTKRALDVQSQVRDHPYFAGGLLALILGTVSFLIYRVVEARRAQSAPAPQLGRRLRATTEEIGARLAELEHRRQASMLKRVLWAMFTAGMVALATLLTRRLSATLWSTAMREPPPRHVS